VKKLRLILGLIIVLILSTLVGGYIFLSSTAPELDLTIAVSEIGAEVEIIRDSYGMPHIYAHTEEDAAFALGYCTAQDRLFQMELIRRTVGGRLSEILGEDLVKVDKLFRTITAAKPIEEMFDEMSPELAVLMEAYAAGINHYLKFHEENLPFEFSLLGFDPEPWKAADELSVLYYMAWGLNFSFDTELLHAAVTNKIGPELAAQIFVDYPVGAPTIMGDESFTVSAAQLLESIQFAREFTGVYFRGGSNNWVVSGDKSETGMPILANDMHLGLINPGIWYEAHISCPGLNVSGVVLPGVPLVVAGANDHVAWGFTNVMADDADFYLEKINPDDSGQYEFMGVWKNMDIVNDTISVSGGEDVPIEIRMTHHGVIVSDIIEEIEPSTNPIAMRWTIYEFNQEAQALYQANHASDIYDLERAAALHKCPGQNWVYADDKGNIGFWAATGIPIRNGFDGSLLLPGWDGEHEWDGYVPTDRQPHVRNPSKGWIASANNKHVDDDYPHVISNNYAPPDRIIRINDMLNEKEKFNLDDFKRMHGDDYLVMAKEWTPHIIASTKSLELTDLELRGKELLAGWDFRGRPESAEPAIFHITLQFILENIFKERLGDTLYDYFISENTFTVHKALNHLLELRKTEWFDNPATEPVENIDSVLAKSFGQAIEYLSDRFGDNVDNWIWGELHTVTFFHPIGRYIPIFGQLLNAGPFPMGGGSNSINPGIYRFSNPWKVAAGASQRHIFDLGNMKNSLRVIPTGVSGNFMSDHYTDQVDLWRNVEYRPFVLDRVDVEADAVHVMKMIPISEIEVGISSRSESD
jgi:penicillin amidase